MKIICIGRNYGEHARELGNAIPEEPVLFLKPLSALIPNGGPIRLPSFSQDIHHEIELVYRLERTDNGVSANAVTIGLDLTARDVQQRLKEQGLPWEKAKAFDGSAYVSEHFLSDTQLLERQLVFALKRNGAVVQEGYSGEMIFDLKTMIDCAARYFRLETGDLLFTGTPAGVGRIAAGDRLEGFLNDELRFDLAVEGPTP
ncbi:MAG: fumarylacetoacetate hydrolase family protein [Flavobacteriales bacterium]|nr:fumarylacetoacetate hydrolase family protein [Flavobacteriales bacterium]